MSYGFHFTLYIVQCTVYNVHCTMYTYYKSILLACKRYNKRLVFKV